MGRGSDSGSARSVNCVPVFQLASPFVSNLDPVAYLGSIGLLVVTVALALLLPARRAQRVDPMRALRYD